MHRTTLHRFVFPLLIALLWLGGCSKPAQQADTTESTATYTIVTTTGMVNDLVQRIAGDRASVTGLINSGIDPHLYQPTRNDIKSLMNADMVFYSGLHLEGKMTDAFERVAGVTTVIAVTDSLDRAQLLSPEEYEGSHDPHVWMDPLAWKQAAAVIHDAIASYDPEHRAQYDANLAQLNTEIDALHAYASQTLGSIPAEQRVLVTAHDAFQYFGQRYDFELVGIQGISTESEAGVRDIERIVDLLVSRKIAAVFVETTVSERNIKALIAGAKAQGHTVTIGGALFSDAMGNPGTYEGTYIGMIDHNVTTIARALGATPLAGGMSGMLTTETKP